MPHAKKHPASPADLQVRAEYEAGASTTTLAARWGTDAMAITRAIRRAGGRVRTKGEANALRWRAQREAEALASGAPLAAPGRKRCGKCLEAKPLSEFSRDRRMWDGYDSRCKECDKAGMREWLASHENLAALRKRSREDARLRRFGITPERYAEMLAAQGGVCAICGRPETSKFQGRLRALAVDHDHGTGAVRELLCCGCNQGLGGFRDDPALLEAAAAYLRRHGR
jgi:hypothetical protein